MGWHESEIPEDIIDTNSDDLADHIDNWPTEYIRIIYHPHSKIKKPIIIPINDKVPQTNSNTAPLIHTAPVIDDRPWKPFKTRADFEFAFEAVTNRDRAGRISSSLKNIKQHYHTGGTSNLTFQTNEDVQQSLSHARKFATKVSQF
jgi:hypothetical protein